MPQPSAAVAPVRSYRDLRVWQQAMDLAEATYRATEQFPEEERYSARLGFASGRVSEPGAREGLGVRG